MTSLCRVVPVWHGLSRADLTVRLGRSGVSLGHPSGPGDDPARFGRDGRNRVVCAGATCCGRVRSALLQMHQQTLAYAKQGGGKRKLLQVIALGGVRHLASKNAFGVERNLPTINAHAIRNKTAHGKH